MGGLAEILFQPIGRQELLEQIVVFLACVIGTCAAFYIFFLCRMLGAGDIKLMALCVGILGAEQGIPVIFLGLSLAAMGAARILWREGTLWNRMERLGRFAVCLCRKGKLEAYPGWEEKESLMHLGSWMFLGYCVWLLLPYI